MKTFTIFSVILIAVLSPFPTDLKAQSLSQFDKEISKWNYKGKVSIGMSLLEFRRNYRASEMIKEQSNLKIGDLQYWVFFGEDKDVQSIFVNTYKDKIYRVVIIYSVNFVRNKVGGYDNFLLALRKRYGLAHADSKGGDVEKPWLASYYWRFPKVSRYLGAEVNEEYLRVTVTDMMVFSIVSDLKKSNVDLGF